MAHASGAALCGRVAGAAAPQPQFPFDSPHCEQHDLRQWHSPSGTRQFVHVVTVRDDERERRRLSESGGPSARIRFKVAEPRGPARCLRRAPRGARDAQGGEIPSIKALLVLDGEGKRIVARYYKNQFATPAEETAFEKKLYDKTMRSNAKTEGRARRLPCPAAPRGRGREHTARHRRTPPPCVRQARSSCSTT